jgi:hypothetical protein
LWLNEKRPIVNFIVRDVSFRVLRLESWRFQAGQNFFFPSTFTIDFVCLLFVRQHVLYTDL